MKMNKQIAKIKADFEAFVVKMRHDIAVLESAAGGVGRVEDDEPGPPDPEPGGPGNGPPDNPPDGGGSGH